MRQVMKVGLRSPYQRCDATFIALRVARVAQEMGYAVEIMPRDKPASSLFPNWDRVVLRNPKLDYLQWLESGMSYLIYTEPPVKEELTACARLGIRTIYLALWDHITEADAKILHHFTRVVCPARCCKKLIVDRLGLSNVMACVWDPGTPVTQDLREVDPGRVGVLWPVGGDLSISFLGSFETFLKKCLHVWATIVYTSDLAAGTVRELRRLSLAMDGRLELIKDPLWDRLQIIYGRHDLTIWPVTSESLGLVGLCSIHMGTPVLAFDHPLIGEIVADGKNGILVPCNLKYNWLEVPSVDPDYSLFGEHLARTAADAPLLTHLRRTTTNGLYRRRKQFQAFWQGMFSSWVF